MKISRSCTICFQKLSKYDLELRKFANFLNVYLTSRRKSIFQRIPIPPTRYLQPTTPSGHAFRPADVEDEGALREHVQEGHRDLHRRGVGDDVEALRGERVPDRKREPRRDLRQKRFQIRAREL